MYSVFACVLKEPAMTPTALLCPRSLAFSHRGNSGAKVHTRLLLASAAILLSFTCGPAGAQEKQLASLIEPHDYVQKRVSSFDKTGGNADALHIDHGATA